MNAVWLIVAGIVMLVFNLWNIPLMVDLWKCPERNDFFHKMLITMVGMWVISFAVLIVGFIMLFYELA